MSGKSLRCKIPLIVLLAHAVCACVCVRVCACVRTCVCACMQFSVACCNTDPQGQPSLLSLYNYIFNFFLIMLTVVDAMKIFAMND